MSQALRILMLSSEVVPFSKTGGLADVVGALAHALSERGHQVQVVSPLYGPEQGSKSPALAADLCPLPSSMQVRAEVLGGVQELRVFQSPKAKGSPEFYFLSHPWFERKGFYGDEYGEFGDNHLRFALLNRGALDLCRRHLGIPNILHLHDWQSALAAVDLRGHGREVGVDREAFKHSKLVFTVHNLAYMGRFEHRHLAELGLGDELFTPETLEFYQAGALIKGGILWADAITTVSPRYAFEVQTPELGYGLDGLLRSRNEVLHGILNGIDTSEWNPASDVHLPAHYNSQDQEGKRLCKLALLKEMGLPFKSPEDAQAPLFGVVARLAWQKGIDLVAEITPQLLQRGGKLVILGTGEPDLEARLRILAEQFPRSVAIRLGFNEALAHRIEAGSDIFLMPSRYEPCGLNQLYSLRYGTVPVVRAVGGLDDTVEELDSHHASGNGFKFGAASSGALWSAVLRAFDAYAQPEVWQALIRRGMEADFSWDASARAYEELFLGLAEGSQEHVGH